MDTAAQSRKPMLYLGQTEPRLFARNDQITGQGHFESAAQGSTVHGCDDRLVQIKSPRNTRKAGWWQWFAPEVCPMLQVSPGAESLVTSTRENRYPLVRVRGEFVKRASKLPGSLGMQSVGGAGPIDGNDREPPVTFNLYASLFGRHALGLLQDMHGTGAAQANHVGHTHGGALHLSRTGLPPKMGDDLVDVGDSRGPQRMALR